MSAASQHRLCIPGRTGREFWYRDGPYWEKEVLVRQPGRFVFAIEAVALESVPFWAVAPPGGMFDVDRVAALRREGMGISIDGGAARSWMQQELPGGDGRVLVASFGLSGVLDKTAVAAMPSAFGSG